MTNEHTPRSLRALHGLTQQELAKLARVSVSTVKVVESGGDVTTTTLSRVAGALQVTSSELLEAMQRARAKGAA